MRKILITSTFLAVLFVLPTALDAQNTIKIRLFGNSARFLGEPRGEEVQYPMITNSLDTNINYTGFTHQGKLGFGAEVMLSLSERAWVGFEISSSGFSGYNNVPPLYNFYYTDYNQLSVRVIDQEVDVPINEIYFPLAYTTSLINTLANFRFYLSSEGMFRPFIKAHAGVSFVASELGLKNASDWPNDQIIITVNGNIQNPDNLDFGAPILYSRGTNTSPEGRFAALNLGGGAGFEVPINGKISFYADYTYSMINSDILDGRPNVDYLETGGLLKRFNTMGNVGRISFGLCYTIGENFNIINTSGGGGKGGGKSGRQHPYLPFYEIKRAR